MEAKLFPDGYVPAHVTRDWYAERETAPHLEQEGHRERLLLTAVFVRQALDSLNRVAPTVIDLGCGDGGLLSLMPAFCKAYGYDLQQSNVDAAQARGVDVRYGNVLELNLLPADVYVATEMLEHLEDPYKLLRRIHATETPWLVASSPYTETAESHYEYHTYAWDLEGYTAMFAACGYKVVRQETAWICQVVLAERV